MNRGNWSTEMLVLAAWALFASILIFSVAYAYH